MWGKLESDHTHPEKGSEKTEFMPWVAPWPRDSL